MNTNDESRDNDIDMDQVTPIDLKGSEQHHELKDKNGEKGDRDHTSDDDPLSDKVDSSVKDAVAEGNEKTAVGSALKKAVEE